MPCYSGAFFKSYMKFLNEGCERMRYRGIAF